METCQLPYCDKPSRGGFLSNYGCLCRKHWTRVDPDLRKFFRKIDYLANEGCGGKITGANVQAARLERQTWELVVRFAEE